ncbi:arsenate reductase ArsC [Actinokineospora xionganensis]|uniref:Arsenate reductase ArsC n=1 Tax=Actinokineospora xionganensis TaxID=2684470 RepID=A0ABR7LEU9_9PSEU|nr:arsenate reductase ArsC [Actinokineospora xionganensis]MBC6451244.1 arsenate reductase ArsC [Actinokineospora xionganensis]
MSGIPEPAAEEVRRELGRITDELTDRYTGIFDRDTVSRFVWESYDLLAAHATVRHHLVALTSHFAKDRLAAYAEGLGAGSVPQVLFLCVHNAGRSQMAAALLRRHALGRVSVRSAGSAPTGLLDPTCVESLAEIGIDLHEAFPKPLTDEVVNAADVVVSMGCGDTCPVYPGKSYLDWDVPDPAGQPLAVVRQIRDDLDNRVRQLLDDLTGGTDS